MSRRTPRMKGVSANSHVTSAMAPPGTSTRAIWRAVSSVSKKMERVGDDHQVEAGCLEGKIFSGPVERP